MPLTRLYYFKGIDSKRKMTWPLYFPVFPWNGAAVIVLPHNEALDYTLSVFFWFFCRMFPTPPPLRSIIIKTLMGAAGIWPCSWHGRRWLVHVTPLAFSALMCPNNPMVGGLQDYPQVRWLARKVYRIQKDVILMVMVYSVMGYRLILTKGKDTHDLVVLSQWSNVGSI